MWQNDDSSTSISKFTICSKKKKKLYFSASNFNILPPQEVRKTEIPNLHNQNSTPNTKHSFFYYYYFPKKKKDNQTFGNENAEFLSPAPSPPPSGTSSGEHRAGSDATPAKRTEQLGSDKGEGGRRRVEKRRGGGGLGVRRGREATR